MERKEAIEIVKSNLPDSIFTVTALHEALETLIPELAESEDELMRKEAISIIKQYNIICEREGDKCYTADRVITWLEKQDKQTNKINSYEFTFEDVLASECAMNTAKIIKDDEELYKMLVPLYNKIHKYYLLGKQDIPKDYNSIDPHFGKPIDNFGKPIDTASKFKVGDWVVSGARGTAHIIDIGANDSEFLLEYTDGDQESLSIEYVNSTYTEWNIQKAWEGDVLVCGDDKRPFIFKGLLDQIHPNCPVAYCGIDSGHNFIASRDDSWWTSREVKPATKEQQDYLFQKMREAGYMWEGHTKKLVCK